jgi:hypothetical protein
LVVVGPSDSRLVDRIDAFGRVAQELTRMTTATARAVANVVLASAGLAATYVIVTTPPLRRLALRGVRLWLGAGVPVYLLTEVHRAWVESAPTA